MIECEKHLLPFYLVPERRQKQRGGGERGPQNLSQVSHRAGGMSEYYPQMSGHYEGWLRQGTRPARPGPSLGTNHPQTQETGSLGEGLLPLALT